MAMTLTARERTRREFLRLSVAACAIPLARAQVAQGVVERPAFPYVDGLSFLSSPAADFAASGLTAFICDVSSAERLKTEDGSLKFFRSFEACARSLTAARRTLASGSVPGAFLATRGSQVDEAWKKNGTAVFFQFQGSEPIGDQLWRLDLFYELGLRVLQITHHNDNVWGGGAIEKTWTGLTKTGHEGVERMNVLGIIPDLAHVSDPTSLDVLKISRKPVVLSHGAARALVNTARCTPDVVIKGVADSGGVMGVFMMSFWLTDPTPTTDSQLDSRTESVLRIARAPRPARISYDALALTPGTRLGAYEIVASIGAGGMGEVYRARDAGSIATSR